MVKMLFADRLAPEQVAQLVEATRHEAEAERTRLAAIVEQLEEYPSAYWARTTALFGLRHAEATLLWADEMRRQLNQKPRRQETPPDPLLAPGRVPRRKGARLGDPY
jgi:hypothetical protein